jgi:hypothetical protein
MSNQFRQDFSKFLNVGGYCTPPGRAACALNSARTLAEWREAEGAGLVRISMDEEQESYFNVYGEPDTQEEKDRLVAMLESKGLYVVYSEVNTGNEYDGDKWEVVDSIGMCCYDNPTSPFENDYVIGLMRAALDAIPVYGEH